MERMFQQVYVIPGTLAANHLFNFITPTDVQLLHASIVNTTANAGTLKIGSASDDDYYLAAENFGVSSTPVEVSTPAGWDGVGAGGAYPHILKGSTVNVLVTDHASHMANVCVILTFTQG